MTQNPVKPVHGWRRTLHEIIFEADTPAGRLFDIILIIAILFSVLVVLLDSVTTVRMRYAGLLFTLEWLFTLLFTVEYILRLLCVLRPAAYARSFFGVVDLLAILPTWATLLLPGTHYLAVVRLLRVLRIFRVLKLAQYVSEARHLIRALRDSRRKILVFLLAVLSLVTIFGTLMYVIEGEKYGFTSIPRSMYWAVVTLTTVGYGDISPGTPLGQGIASFIMLLGYGIIAVPTGIVTSALVRPRPVSTQACPACGRDGHDVDAVHCKYCGTAL
ncbi:Ion transport protein [Oleidesulfovibrio alaskensis G20]|uniref:Ion transport protein n=1 Tax=Oleidesulfovibrio alaskensis (strain ATCC BAA-1058 / DSM 17464 / G20) TaxID=207559 RepID=Q30WZ7_OLEA2|nr:ion transporter [Oleidesulfovibrio alaskensis]ABB39799.1 Ion transport protein [Oleidesulfovibrio alaskensis G20]MBG0773415.1 ion transporter [Oleidesulfovibrio alaskensis]MBL3581986.1 ion transporter [Oleidesulfovibrio alaskensis]